MTVALEKPNLLRAVPHPRRWSAEEYSRAIDTGIFRDADALDLVDGVIVVRDTSRPRIWSRDEYYRAGYLGLFRPDERLELIDGEVIEKVSPVGSPHSTTVYRVAHVLYDLMGPGYYVHTDVPVSIAERTEPEPDVYVAIGTVDDYEDHHPGPAEARLIVEVSDSTVAYDRGKKAMLYAGAGIPEYWIVNLPMRRLEVYRDPTPEAGYLTLIEFSDNQNVAPLEKPDAAIQVSDLFPRKHV